MRNLDFSTKVFRLLMLVLLLFSVQISRADEGWPRTLKGRIVDAKSGETLIGVNIQILGTTTGTISDFDGGFQLVVKANSVIQFSYVGYKPIEIKAEEAVKKTVLLVVGHALVKHGHRPRGHLIVGNVALGKAVNDEADFLVG